MVKKKIEETKELVESKKAKKEEINTKIKEKRKENETKTQKFIYIGDTISTVNINIVKNTIVESLTPFEIAFEKDKELKELFVDIKEFAKIKYKLSDPNFKLNRIIKKRRK